jgi:hypothetical protein
MIKDSILRRHHSKILPAGKKLPAFLFNFSENSGSKLSHFLGG